MNKNFDQWSTVINLDTLQVEICLQGYGYVGLNGDLTGGEIPYEFFNVTTGFDGTLLPLEDLKTPNSAIDADAKFKISDVSQIHNLNPLDNGNKKVCIGTPERQWYLYQNPNNGHIELSAIVSHLKYNGTAFYAELFAIAGTATFIYAKPAGYEYCRLA